MSLTQIEYGSLASSELMNNNFNYLDDKIDELSTSSINNFATLNSNIATMSASLSSLSDETSENITRIDRKSTRLNSSHIATSRMPSSA